MRGELKTLSRLHALSRCSPRVGSPSSSALFPSGRGKREDEKKSEKSERSTARTISRTLVSLVSRAWEEGEQMALERRIRATRNARTHERTFYRRNLRAGDIQNISRHSFSTGRLPPAGQLGERLSRAGLSSSISNSAIIIIFGFLPVPRIRLNSLRFRYFSLRVTFPVSSLYENIPR